MGRGGIAPPVYKSALDGGEWSASRPGHFIPGERAPRTHWIGGWVGLRADLGRCGEEKHRLSCRGSNPGRPTCNLSVYRLRYPGSNKIIIS
jgi:hypothetical protein